MLARARLSFGRLLLIGLLLSCLSQCAVLQRFDSPSEREASREGEAAPQEAPENATGDLRVVAVDDTPFFRWLRSGLRSDAKPTRFLEKGIEVELLEENEEEKFSRVRLPDGKKGWVPSRLVRDPADTSGASRGQDLTEEDPLPESAAGSGPADIDPNLLPEPGDDVPPMVDDLGPPIIPLPEITPPSIEPLRPPATEEGGEQEEATTEESAPVETPEEIGNEVTAPESSSEEPQR